MTLNFRVKDRLPKRADIFTRSLMQAAAVSVLIAACAPLQAFDTPAASLDPNTTIVVQGPVSEAPAEPHQRLAIKTAQAFEVSPEDDALLSLIHPSRRALFVAPVFIAIETSTPFDATPRGAMPAVIVNGEPLYDSFLDPKDPTRISAILPDGRRVDLLALQVGMNGDLEKTISEPVRIRFQRLQ